MSDIRHSRPNGELPVVDLTQDDCSVNSLDDQVRLVFVFDKDRVAER
jgi:hypothetical protein